MMLADVRRAGRQEISNNNVVGLSDRLVTSEHRYHEVALQLR